MNEKELEREIRRLKQELRELEDDSANNDINSDNFLESIKEASNSSYTTHIYIEASPDDTPEEIEQERQRLMVLASQNKKCESVIAKDLDTTTLQELIDEYIRVETKQNNWSEKTIKNNSALFKVLTDYIKNDTLLINIKPDSFNNFLTFMLKRVNPKGGTYKPQTINRILNDLKKFFDRAVDLRKIPNNPMNWLKPLKEPEADGCDAIDKDTMHRIFHKYDFKQDYKDMYKVLAYTGFRSGELFHLQCQDLITN